MPVVMSTAVSWHESLLEELDARGAICRCARPSLRIAVLGLFGEQKICAGCGGIRLTETAAPIPREDDAANLSHRKHAALSRIRAAAAALEDQLAPRVPPRARDHLQLVQPH